ncbi:carboxymuconolactone decarboxylase family protein [Rhodopila sp.]|jgi:AhpD family alkylhydroperoxidase|uniref:carboxymuconolactone decarboxylase family protein n=1 Tax=Rhodopila sp. TaxID=2480087 RepID=UPI002CD68352|nr:carboxymuconolactone decarboxylase family protein [Rhodopila sp.]HVZ10570.1 carboxymuconolactone decarboxylase family protein [Rhodopila sp.]
MHAQRLSLQTVPEAYAAVGGVERYIRACGLEKSLIELVKLRASQINGCAFCIDMHSRDARQAGESEQRLYLLSAWRESPLFTPRERAALDWTECLTRLPTDGAPDPVYAALQTQFSPIEIANLTTLIGLINLWNRIGVGFALQHPVPAQAAA